MSMRMLQDIGYGHPGRYNQANKSIRTFGMSTGYPAHIDLDNWTPWAIVTNHTPECEAGLDDYFYLQALKCDGEKKYLVSGIVSFMDPGGSREAGLMIASAKGLPVAMAKVMTDLGMVDYAGEPIAAILDEWAHYLPSWI